MHLGLMSYSVHFSQQKSKRTRHTLPEKKTQQTLYPMALTCSNSSLETPEQYV